MVSDNGSLSLVILLLNGNSPTSSPLHKKGNKAHVENYRPISLMCVVAKVLERCIYNRLIDHLHNMISEAQYGFLKGKSCTTQLLTVLHRIGRNFTVAWKGHRLFSFRDFFFSSRDSFSSRDFFFLLATFFSSRLSFEKRVATGLHDSIRDSFVVLLFGAFIVLL